jgi:nucleoside 2-deoxyribosyltransferase
MSRCPRIYLAGPEVFLPDANEAGRIKCAVAAEHGFEGVYPLDASLDLAGQEKRAQATFISRSNEDLMRSCDGLIANLTPFRGASADVGTAFEVGFLRALGRPVLGYTNSALDYVARAHAVRAQPRLAFDADAPTVAIEDFDLSENLMIEIAIEASGSRLVRTASAPGLEMTDLTGFRACLVEARRLLLT